MTGRRSPFLDGSANLGYWSVVASNECDEPGRVVAVEPVPAIFERLRENARLNGDRFVCEQAALWSEPDVDLTMASHPQWHAGSRVLHGPRAAAEGQYTTRVPTTTIDRRASSTPTFPPLESVAGSGIRAPSGRSSRGRRSPRSAPPPR